MPPWPLPCGVMIQVSSLCRRFADFRAVDDVSFEIGRGEIVGLLGHNGAGKTTVMKMLTGLLEPTSGKIFINHQQVATQRRAAQRMIGYLAEDCPLYDGMCVIDYLDWMADLKDLATADKAVMVAEAVAATDLQRYLLQRIATLSRGMRQRVGVAQAILGRPPVLILDEPTSGLDPGQIKQMRLLIKQAAATSTVILSTHILQEVEAVCDRVLLLRGGRLVVDAPLQSLCSSGQLLLRAKGDAGIITALPGEVGLVEGVNAVDADEYRLSVAAGREDEAAAGVVRRLVEQGVEISAIAPRHDPLDTLFHHPGETGER
jgi:ABC-2 type transport system ATP-binding protein